MKIKSMHFYEFGPLADQVISLEKEWDDVIEPRILFSGPNGCGKSTVLRVVAMLWDALGYWLDHRKSLPKNHATREWLQRWGGCALILDQLSFTEQTVGLLFGDLNWCNQIQKQNAGVRWIGEGVSRTGRPGAPKREMFMPNEAWLDEWVYDLI